MKHTTKQTTKILCLLILIFCSAFAKAQSWQQLGPGAGGQERAVYLDFKANNKYDLYVGSDVSGVWKATDIDPAKIADPTSYNYTYISNHTIMRFTNKFYHSSITPFKDKLFVTYRNGIDRIDLNSNAPMQTAWAQDDSWVSDMYIGPQSGVTSQVYFTTGNTRVNGEESNRKSPTTNDFFYGTISSSNFNVTITSSFKFSGLDAEGHVFCLNVDEGATAANTDDAFLVGTENGLYQFNYASLPASSISHVTGPSGNAADAYKVTSIQLASPSTPNLYLITINGKGIFLYNKTNGTWTSQIIELFGEELTGGNTNYHDFATDYTVQNFNNLLPLKTVGGVQYGWLLLNENNLINLGGGFNYFVGVFYCPVISSANNLPDGKWKALSTWVGANDWAWNDSKPCANINGALLTRDNSLLIGKSGNIMISSKPVDAVTPLNTTWIQIHSKEVVPTTGVCSDLYSNRGYVNTALKSIYKDNSGKIWNAQADRLLWVSEDDGSNFKEVQKGTGGTGTGCFGIGLLLPLSNCGSANASLTDCFFITNNPYSSINDLYAGLGSGTAQSKGTGHIVKLGNGPNSNDFYAVGSGICGDPLKLLFTNDGTMYALFNDISSTPSYTHLFKYNNATSNWNPIQLFSGGVTEGLLDAVISPNGKDLFIIKNSNKKFYRFNFNGTSWIKDVNSDFPTGSLANNIECNKICLLPFEDLLSNPNPSYKILCGTQPLNATASYNNFYELFKWTVTGTTGTATNSSTTINSDGVCTGSDIFQNLYIDNLDEFDGGINYIEVNPILRTIYVSTVYKATTAPMRGRVYRGTYNQAGDIATCWNEITIDMPNKAVKYMSSHGSTSCADEYIYAAVRGLGGWKLDLNKPTFSAVTSTGCSNNSGTATAIAPASFINPTYLWSNSTSATTATITGLSAGTYTVTVSANGFCTTTASVIIPAEILTIKKNNPSCNQGNNGSATANYSGIVDTYAWTGGATTQTITDLSAGTYIVTVTVLSGCSVTASVSITNPTLMGIGNTTSTNAICDGERGGTLTVPTTGGTKPWQFTINNLPAQTSNVFTNLPAATYSVTVTDFNGCTATTTATTVGKISQLPLSGTPTAGQAYDIIGTVTLTGSLDLTGCTLYATDHSNVTFGSFKTFSLTTSTINSCNNMWQGIVVQSDGTLKIENSTIKDAQYAVEVKNGAIFTSNGATFDRNFVGVYANNHSNANITIKGSTFKCTGCLTGNPLKNGYTGQPTTGLNTFAGILADNSTFNIGVSGAASNVFDGLYRGVSLRNCYTTVLNSTFKNMPLQSEYFELPTDMGGGIGIAADVTSAGKLTQTGFGDYTGATASFNNCYYAIMSRKGGLDASGNTMTTMVNGIKCFEVDAQTIDISANNIAASKVAIALLNNELATRTDVVGNFLTINGSSARGITVSEFTTTAVGRIFKVNCNTIVVTKGLDGIYLNSTSRLNLKQNHVTLPLTTAANGIRLNGTSNCTLVENSVYGNGTGLSTCFLGAASASNSFTNNHASNSQFGFDFSNGCQMDENFKGNTMFNHNVGLHLNSNGIIGIQTHKGNKWSGTFSAWGAKNENGDPNLVLFKPIIVHEPNSGTLYHPTNFVSASVTWIDFQVSSTWFSATYLDICSADQQLTYTPYEARLSYTDTLIVNDNITAVEYEPELKQITKRDLQDKLNENDTLISNNIMFQDFFAENQTTPMGELSRIMSDLKTDTTNFSTTTMLDSLIQIKLDSMVVLDSMLYLNTDSTINNIKQVLVSTLQALIAQKQTLLASAYLTLQSKFATAKNNNQVIVSSNDIEQYEQEINDFHFTYLDSALLNIPTSAIENVETIASLCPYAYGKAVYKARSELARLNMDTAIYDDKTNCATLGYYRLMQNHNTSDKKEVADVVAYPNPGADVVYVQFAKYGFGNATIIIRDVMGKTVFMQEQAFADQTLTINVSALSTGIYTLTVENEVINSKQIKIAIIK